MAQQPEYANVQFTSIVLDECDGARNIIETPDDEPRWKHINHYYMDRDYKEEAKDALGFSQVPFYVVLNERGEIIQKGNKKQIDFKKVPGVVFEEEEKEEETVPMERVFCMDEDF